MNKWRFIQTETHSPAVNMALDEACMDAVRNQQVLPTIRLYRWRPSSISIGYFQSLEREVDIDACTQNGVSIVRRQTGGGAVYHDYEGELTYSVIAPVDLFPSNIIKSYEEICGWVINGLSQCGIKAEFVPINDIITGGKKISGNAQTRRRGVLLQHGTILYKVDVKKMFSLLKVPDEKLRDKMISVVEERVTSVHDIAPQIAFEQLEKAISKSFLAGKDVVDTEWTPAELEAAQELANTKYSHNSWNLMK